MFKTLAVFMAAIFCAYGYTTTTKIIYCTTPAYKNFDLTAWLLRVIRENLPKLIVGFPEYDIPSMQPFLIPNLTIEQGNGPVTVVQTYEDFKVFNIPSTVVDSAGIILTENEFDLTVDGILPEMVIDANYDFNGNVMLLPFEGQGPVHMVFTDVKTHLDVHGNMVEKDGEKYAVVEVGLTLDPENIFFKFDNLFNGNEQLGNEMNLLINENWKDVWDDVKGSYEQAFAREIQDLANRFFSKVPTNQVFPPDN